MVHLQRSLTQRPQQERRALIVLAAAAAVTWLTICYPSKFATAAAATAVPQAALGGHTSDDLLIVGAGRLGRRVASLWRKSRPSAKIVAATLSDRSHQDLQKEGLQPVTIEQLEALSPELPRWHHVLFAAPPSRSAEPGAYATAVESALKFCRSSNDKGNFVFTSSASVYAEDSGKVVDESSPLATSDSAKRLLAAEGIAREAGGTILRLAGLYDVDVGPHAYWLKVGKVTGPADGLINMLHYNDAAAAAVAALDLPQSEHGIFVVADGSPISRLGICEAAVAAKPFAGASFPTFEVPIDGTKPMGGSGKGKVLDASKARRVLGWKPTFESFAGFMRTL